MEDLNNSAEPQENQSTSDFEKRISEVYNYISKKLYPKGITKVEKLSIRRYASKFEIKDGSLYYLSRGNRRKVVSSLSEAKALFKEFHASVLGGHGGIEKTRRVISSRFYWPGMTRDLIHWITTCEQCRKAGDIPVDPTLHRIKKHSGKELITPQPPDVDCDHSYSCVSELDWSNGSNDNSIVTPLKMEASCTDIANLVIPDVTIESGDEHTTKELSKVTRGCFMSIQPNQGVFQSESWQPNHSTLYHPVNSQILVNIEKYDQISFEEGSFFTEDTSGGCLQKESGHTIHCWRYEEKDKKLFIALSFLFTNFSIYQEAARILGAI